MCPFFTIPFFAWHHTETVLVLHQTPLKLHVFTSEVSTMQIMALFHLTLNPWQQSCLDHAARTGTRAMAGECSARAMASENCVQWRRKLQLQTGSRRQSDKKTILKHFLKGILKGKLLAPKLRKSADNSLSQP